MAELTFWTNPMSRGRIVRWMLEETGAEYDTNVVQFGPDMNTPEFRAINPMAKVPVIRHGDAIVTEAAAICAYLADAFPEADLAPEPRTPERGPYYRWLFFGAGPVEAAVSDASAGWSPETPQLQGRFGYGSLQRVLDTLDELLADREWILGDRFSAADVYLGAQISWGVQFGTMERRPAFGPYIERLQGRPAARRAREKDDALMPKEAG